MAAPGGDGGESLAETRGCGPRSDSLQSRSGRGRLGRNQEGASMAKARRATTRCLWHLGTARTWRSLTDGDSWRTLANPLKGWERITVAQAITYVRAGATISRVWRYSAIVRDGDPNVLEAIVDTRPAVSMVDALAGEGRAVIGRVLRRVAAG